VFDLRARDVAYLKLRLVIPRPFFASAAYPRRGPAEEARSIADQLTHPKSKGTMLRIAGALRTTGRTRRAAGEIGRHHSGMPGRLRRNPPYRGKLDVLPVECAKCARKGRCVSV